MRSLHEVVAQVGTDGEWDDARAVVDAVYTELHAEHPSFLAEATGEWKEPYLIIEFKHLDGTVFKVTHGDGYTAVVGGSVDYHGYLDTPRLIDVLIGALRGRVSYVNRSRFGYKVADYFEVVGREGQRVGYGPRGIAGAVPFLLRSIPLLPESVRRTRVSFDGTPAITVSDSVAESAGGRAVQGQ